MRQLCIVSWDVAGFYRLPDGAVVIDDPDIWRAANLLVKMHGGDAAIVAAQRADQLLAEGDMDGLAVWKRIAQATEQLLRKEREEGEAVN